MCLVIDACCLPKVLNPHDEEHAHFQAVCEWIFKGDGRMIYGGTKYRRELRRLQKYLKVVSELNRKGRVIEVADERVDALETLIRTTLPDKQFNDEHLVAIAIASRCCVICTNDGDAIRYLKRSELYSPHRMRRPRIYSSERNADLCCRDNVTQICRRGS